MMVGESSRANFFLQCLKYQVNIYWHFQKQQGIGFHGAFQHSSGAHTSEPSEVTLAALLPTG